jgi:EmrB/QacA subfamily drug resistance transporter
MAAAAFMDLLDGTIVQVALPSIQRDLKADHAILQWTVSGYTLAFALLLVTGARLGSRVGRRRCFLAGLALFVIASAAAAAAQSGGMLVGFRAVQGAASALMLPQVLSFIQAEFTGAAKSKAFATYGMVLALAGAAGPLLGGVLVEANIAGLAWRSIFLVNVPVGIAAFVFGGRLIPESVPDRSQRLNPAGTSVLTLALLAIFYPLIQGRQLGWPPWAFACLGASVPLLALFALIQARSVRAKRPPLIDLALFRSRGTCVGLVIALLFFGATSCFFVLTLYLQSGLGFSPLRTGVSFIPFSIAVIIGSAGAAPLGQRLGRLVVAAGTLGTTAALVSMVALVGHYGSGLHAWQLAPSLAVAGLAFGVASGTLADIVLDRVPARLAAGASGLINTVIQLGSVLAIAVVGAIFFDSLSGRPDVRAFTSAATSGLWYLAASCALATIGTVFLPSRRGAMVAPPPATEPASDDASGWLSPAD